jgi:hypothetical protein
MKSHEAIFFSDNGPAIMLLRSGPLTSIFFGGFASVEDKVQFAFLLGARFSKELMEIADRATPPCCFLHEGIEIGRGGSNVIIGGSGILPAASGEEMFEVVKRYYTRAWEIFSGTTPAVQAPVPGQNSTKLPLAEPEGDRAA